MDIFCMFTPLKTNMTWKIPIFNRRYIFKRWMFHCHVSFRGGNRKCLKRSLWHGLDVVNLDGGPARDFRERRDDGTGHISRNYKWRDS